MRDVYIVEAVRSPIGRRRGDLATLHPGDLLGAVQKGALDKRGVDPAAIDQVIGGCVSQVGEQSFNIARCAWLSQGLPLEVPQTTIDSQCGSSQQATTLAMGLVGSGMADVTLSCGLEMMTRVPLGANMAGGSPLPKSYFGHYAFNSQFGGAQLIGDEFGITREDTDRFGLRSQELAIAAWDAGHFDAEVVPVEAPIADEEGKPTSETQIVKRDGGLRKTSLEKLAALEPVKGQTLHTAGSSSQVSDGAAALILASEEGARRLGVEPRARIVSSTIVGVDPVTMLKGPIPATEKVLARDRSEDRSDRHLRGERGLRVGGAGLDEGLPSGGGEGQSAGGCDRDRSSDRRHRGAAAHHGASHAGAHGRPLRPGRDVLRRRSRDRHHHRAGLMGIGIG